MSNNFDELNDIIGERINTLKLADPASEESQKQVTELGKLIDIQSELSKTELAKQEAERAADASIDEWHEKEAEQKAKDIDRIVNIAFRTLELGLPIICFGRWIKHSFKFEETGSYGATTSKEIIKQATKILKFW